MIKRTIDSDKLLSFFSSIPLHPNHITLLSIVLAILAFFTFSYDPLYSLILFALSFFIDALDGVVARAKNLVSNKGAFLDGISDRVVEFFLILTILMYFSLDQAELFFTISILFFGTCMTSFVKAYADHRNALTREKAKDLPGILERAERVILLFLTLVLFVYFPEYGIYPLILASILSILTFLQRTFLVLKS